MQPSPLKHVLAIVRTTVGLTQKELAAVLGCSVPTIQSIELGRLKLSEGLAQRVVENTGVDLACLLHNDPSQPVLDQTGQPYTRAEFDRWQANKAFSQDHAHSLPEEVGDYMLLWSLFKRHVRLLAETLAHAYTRNQSRLFAYKCNLALKQLADQFLADRTPEEFERRRQFSVEQEKIRRTDGMFFLTGLPEILLYFQAEIDREFHRRAEGAPWGDFGESLAATENCLRAFKTAHDKFGHAVRYRQELNTLLPTARTVTASPPPAPAPVKTQHPTSPRKKRARR